jgi:hypothetical protein
VHKALADAEAVTKAKKKKKMLRGREKTESSDGKYQDMSDNNMDIRDLQKVEISTCIKVRMR